MEISKGEDDILRGFRCQIRVRACLWDIDHASGNEPASFVERCLHLLAVAHRDGF
jgi:hypothetical protein